MQGEPFQYFYIGYIGFFHLFCGNEIGRGIARTVYACDVAPNLVVKIEDGSQSFQNVLEWEFWQHWKDDRDVARWLAPCEKISSCGTVLLQSRTGPCPKDRYPKDMPKFLTDLKYSNFGLIGRRLVCHDYALAIMSLHMGKRRAHWWGDEDS